MKTSLLTTLIILGGSLSGAIQAQTKEQIEFYRGVEAFEKSTPTVGDRLPELTLYHPDGREVKTTDLRGHYTVLTLGCLT